MCRLIGWVSAHPQALAQLVGHERLDALVADVSRLHPDGWGAALTGVPDRGPAQASTTGTSGSDDSDLVVERSTRGAVGDPDFVELARTAPARAGLLHLRRATAGYEVNPANTHPFLVDGWAFAHNGTVPEAERIDAILGGQWQVRRRGTTDSERYFLCVLERIEKHGDVVDGVRAAVDDIREECGLGSMNAMLLGHGVLVVVHARDGAAPPVDILLETVDGDLSQLPPEHTDQYYDLRVQWRETSIVVSSTGMPDATWDRLPEESVLVADRATGTVTTFPLAGGGSVSVVERPGWPLR